MPLSEMAATICTVAGCRMVSQQLVHANPFPQRVFPLAARDKTFSEPWKFISKAWKYISELRKYISKPLKKFCSLPPEI